MGIGLLGPVRVDSEATLEPRDRIALCVLAVRRGRVVSADQFAEALWGDDLPSSWPKQVQICVGRLRKVLGATAIETVPGGYRLALDGDDVDVHRFEQLIERGRLLMATGEADRATAAYARALSLWRGSPLDEVDGWLPGRSEAARLEELRRTTEEEWMDARLAAGDHRAVAADAEALVSEHPLRERRWVVLALAQYRCGRQADALRSLARARNTLVDQSGIDPGPDLIALEAAILRQDASLAAAPEPAVASGACPYKGLAYYDVDDTESFFGRQAEVIACMERLRSASLLVVAGPSGCGKSSLVRAGLVPALREGGRPVVVFVPGADPAAAMIDAIASVGGSPVLVIDQFEELFTLGSATDAVQSFSQRVADYARDCAPAVLAVRSDHLGGLSVDPTLSRLAEQGLHLVNPLTGETLREAIEKPAALGGLRLEPGLVDVLARDCEGEPGALPLLSHALVETWRRRDGTVLTVEGYRASGGIRGAVARSADRLYDSLPPHDRQTLRSVLLRLVAPSFAGDPVRCRVPSRSLLDDPSRERLVAMLVRSRLVTSEADSFELAHEALARAWPRLQSWLEDDAAGQRTLRHLTTAAEGWESLGRLDSELYRGARLEAALEWREATHPDLTTVERAFLEASGQRAANVSRALVDRARRDARQNRRLRAVLAAAALLLVASLVAGGLALRGRHDAREQRDVAHAAQDRAEREGRVAIARELAAAATANLPIDPERSVLLALAAVEHTRSADGSVLPEAEEALHRALTTHRIDLRVPGAGGALDWSADGRLFVTEGSPTSGIVDLRDARTGERVRSLRGHDMDVTDVAFNHEGTLLATTGADGSVRVWNVATGVEMHVVEGAGGRGVWGPSFSADGSYFAAAWPDEDGGVVRVMDLTTGRLVREIDSVPGPIATSFDPSGTRLAVASSQEPTAAVLDAESGESVFTLEGHIHGLYEAAWSPDGSLIATASNDGSARVFDAATGRQRFALLGHDSLVLALDWSPDSTRVVTGSADGTAKLWSLIGGDGLELASLSAHDTRLGINGVAFSPDGTRVMTGDTGVTSTIVWDVGITAGREVANLPGVSYHFGAADFTADGQHLVASAGGGSIKVWDSRTWTSVRTFGGRSTPTSLSPGVPIGTGDDVERLAADPTGRLVAAVRAAGEGRVEVWDAETGQEVFRVAAGSALPWFAWSPDGQVFGVTGGEDGRLSILDTSGGEVTNLEIPDVAISYVAFSADGERLVATVESRASYDPAVGRVAIWNWRTGEIEASINTEAGLAVSSPTGDLIAVAPHWRSDAQAVEVWNSTTGRLVATLAGQTGSVTDIAFTPDGSRLATSGADGTIRLWDPRTGEQQLVLDGHSGSVGAISFNPNGSQLASVGVDGIVRIWALALEDLIDVARERLTRGLTADECAQYLHANNCSEFLRSPNAPD